MSYSAAELYALATRAARGAGFPAAQAGLFGGALVQHLSQGRDESDLMRVLDAAPSGPILDYALNADASPLGQSYQDAANRTGLPARLHPSAELHGALERLAAKTYVPATEASRSAGAGAGLLDND
ncbi:MAG: hypothetical protein MK098_14785 [Marinovum sp.]|nr:hypothetical protein [Marinovum sp.]